jgi:hypothetical protein
MIPARIITNVAVQGFSATVIKLAHGQENTKWSSTAKKGGGEQEIPG